MGFTEPRRRSLADVVEDAGGADEFVRLLSPRVAGAPPNQPPREARRRPRPSPRGRIPAALQRPHHLDPEYGD